MPRVQRQGDDCVFDFGCTNHPWAKIHSSHESLFSDLVAFCRICGAVNSKKGTMQRQCRGRPTRTKGNLSHTASRLLDTCPRAFPPSRNQEVAESSGQTSLDPETSCCHGQGNCGTQKGVPGTCGRECYCMAALREGSGSKGGGKREMGGLRGSPMEDIGRRYVRTGR